MALRNELLRAYQPQFRPSRLGSGFNSAPTPDAFGRAPATPARIQKALDGLDPYPDATPIVDYSRDHHGRRNQKRR